MWDPRAPPVGQQAADLTLLDEFGRPVQVSMLPKPLLVIAFRAPDDEASLRMLCDYRDITLALRKNGVQVCGIAEAEPSTLSYLRHERGLGFPLLADPDGAGLSQWGLDDSNAILLLDRHLRVIQRAMGERAPADAMLAYLRRGKGRASRPPLLARIAQFFRFPQLRHP